MPTKNLIKNTEGYTLIEITIVIAIVLAVSIFSVPFTLSQIQEGELSNKSADIVSAIFSQQQKAYNRVNSKAYGLHFQSDSYTIFIGDDYATAEYTEVIDLPDGMNFSSIMFTNSETDIFFDMGSFRPSDSGTIKIKNSSGVEKQINITSEGLIYFTDLN